jgi:RNA polymerase sigma factor (sigma-70 family)
MNLNDNYAAYKSRPSEDTFTVLFQACRKYALAIALRYRRQDYEDAAATAVAHAWSKLDTFRGASSFKTWFRTTVVNSLNSLHRSDRLERLFAVEPIADLAPEPVSHMHYPLDELDDLSNQQRLVLRILITTGDFRSTAAELGITRKALERRLSRIKQKCSK